MSQVTFICSDVDECRTPANTCKFSCKNLIGSYMCTCPPGYQQVTHSTVAIATTDTRTAESGGKSHECVDVNECELNLDSCANGRCVNLEGSYRCECERGFKLSLDGKQCLGKGQFVEFITILSMPKAENSVNSNNS